MKFPKDLIEQYWNKFVPSGLGVPLSEIAPTELYTDPKLIEMMEESLKTGRPITEAEMDRVFGEDRWEGVRGLPMD